MLPQDIGLEPFPGCPPRVRPLSPGLFTRSSRRPILGQSLSPPPEVPRRLLWPTERFTNPVPSPLIERRASRPQAAVTHPFSFASTAAHPKSPLNSSPDMKPGEPTAQGPPAKAAPRFPAFAACDDNRAVKKRPHAVDAAPALFASPAQCENRPLKKPLRAKVTRRCNPASVFTDNQGTSSSRQRPRAEVASPPPCPSSTDKSPTSRKDGRAKVAPPPPGTAARHENLSPTQRPGVEVTPAPPRPATIDKNPTSRKQGRAEVAHHENLSPNKRLRVEVASALANPSSNDKSPVLRKDGCAEVAPQLPATTARHESLSPKKRPRVEVASKLPSPSSNDKSRTSRKEGRREVAPPSPVPATLHERSPEKVAPGPPAAAAHHENPSPKKRSPVKGAPAPPASTAHYENYSENAAAATRRATASSSPLSSRDNQATRRSHPNQRAPPTPPDIPATPPSQNNQVTPSPGGRKRQSSYPSHITCFDEKGELRVSLEKNTLVRPKEYIDDKPRFHQHPVVKRWRRDRWEGNVRATTERLGLGKLGIAPAMKMETFARVVKATHEELKKSEPANPCIPIVLQNRKWTMEAMILFQNKFETQMQLSLSDAAIAMRHARRRIFSAEDLKCANRIKGKASNRLMPNAFGGPL